MTDGDDNSTLEAMEVHLTPETESQLQLLANRTGRDTAEVIEEAIDRLLEFDARFIAAIEKCQESARRGDLIEHDAVAERVERMFRS